LVGFDTEAEGPVPLVAAGYGRKGDVAVVGEGSVGGVGPGDACGEEADDLPMRKDTLGLPGIGESERVEDEARGFDGRDHDDSIEIEL
jgi:hypothetical protein